MTWVDATSAPPDGWGADPMHLTLRHSPGVRRFSAPAGTGAALTPALIDKAPRTGSRPAGPFAMSGAFAAAGS
ncbi:hypothetical protein ACWGF2_25035 [Streptomyces sp. NPDC054919]